MQCESREQYSDLDVGHGLTDGHDEQGQSEDNGSNEYEPYVSSGDISLSTFQ